MRFIRKYGAAGAALFLAQQAAHAAVPAAVTTAITEAGTDLATAASAILVAMLGVWALKKMGSKFGWW